MKNLLLSLIFIFLAVSHVKSSSKDDRLSREISAFTSSDWKKVNTAKVYLEDKQEQAIPALLEMLDKDTIVKLTNTGDLIYPGAEKFYGHGQIIDYDIDNLLIRSGWIIEEITFHNFGFSTIHDRDEMLIKHVKEEFRKYLNEDYINKLEKSTTNEVREEMKKLAVKKTLDWWKSEGQEWDRFQGIIEALHSNDNRRQILALQYLRSGESKCDGLNIESYLEHLKGRISHLSKSSIKRIAEQSKLILNDHDFEFIKMKTK